MKLALAVGIAAAGLAFSAFAHEMPRIDANQDGWVTRAEASAMAERVFADLDSNNDNRLDTADRAHDQVFEFHIEDDAAVGERIERRVERRVEHGEDGQVERHVIIRRGDGGAEEFGLPTPPPDAHLALPATPLPPGPPMFMMLIANNEEADANGDGALSLEEFRAQHLRYFDASDANGDGRIHFTLPQPPEAPAPPEPPRPPR